MAIVELSAKLRGSTGKAYAKKARRAGLVPAVLYGEGEQPRALELSSRDFYPVIHTAAGENVILDLKIEGANGGDCKAIIREIQYHPVTRDILHVDFQHISMTKEVEIRVPIEVVGESVGVKTQGGILELILRDIDLICLPGNIPDAIKVDVSSLEVGDSIQVRDLQVEGVKVMTEPDVTVITIGAPTVTAPAKPEGEEVEGEEAEEAEGEEEGKKGEKPESGSEAKSE
jgi:large subunit ribosomal protein L25